VQRSNDTALPPAERGLDDRMVRAAAGHIFQCPQHDRSCGPELHAQKRCRLTPLPCRQLPTHAHVCGNGMAFDSGDFMLVPLDVSEKPIRRWEIKINGHSIC